MSINVRGIHKRFGEYVALDGIDLDVPSGKLIALLGPRAAARPVCCASSRDSNRRTPARCIFMASMRPIAGQERRVGFVFQHYALFQHMTVFENVAFGLKVRSARSALRPK